MKKRDRRVKLAPKLLKKLLTPLRKAAVACGYALAVHGSIRRDIDLVAIPWTPGAESACKVSDALYRATERVLGFKPIRSWSMRGRRFTLRGCPGVKPHGRLGWVWQIGGGVYIDLSVMPRKKGEVTT